MSKTFQEIQVDIANIFRSTIDPDDMALENKNEEEYLNVASSCYDVARRMLSEHYFDFNISEKEFKTRQNRAMYSGIDGQIVKDGMLVEGNTSALRYETNGKLLRNQTGRPSKFWLDRDHNITLYPTPDDVYNVTVRYKDLRYFEETAGENEGEALLVPTPTAVLRMPEYLQADFIPWLKYETLVNYIKNEAKPRYQPMINEMNRFKEAFLKNVRGYQEEAFMSL